MVKSSAPSDTWPKRLESNLRPMAMDVIAIAKARAIVVWYDRLSESMSLPLLNGYQQDCKGYICLGRTQEESSKPIERLALVNRSSFSLVEYLSFWRGISSYTSGSAFRRSASCRDLTSSASRKSLVTRFQAVWLTTQLHCAVTGRQDSVREVEAISPSLHAA